MQPAIGLSVGATNLAAVTADSSLTRRPVLTLYPHRQSEVGGPTENINLTEPGLVIADFVNRVGASAGITATDGSKHRAEDLLADGLRALAHAATGGSPLPDVAGVTYPAYWCLSAVAALREALNRVSAWSQGLLLVSEVAGALAALPTEIDVPTGMVAVCDFGGSGTTVTFVDLAPAERGGYAQVGASLRHLGFSGELIDQALVNHVVAELSAGGTFDGSLSSGIGSLARLRAQCRDAKEQLSVAASTVLNVDLPGFQGDVELTRADLDDVVSRPLTTFYDVLRSGLEHNGISGGLVAIAAVGGGANIPGVIAGLSECFQVPVITAPQPQFAAALGAALLAGEGQSGGGVTALVRAGDAAVAARMGQKASVMDTVRAWARRPAALALAAGLAAIVLAAIIGIAMLVRSHGGAVQPTVTPPPSSTTSTHRTTTTTAPPSPVIPPPPVETIPEPVDTGEPEITEAPPPPEPTAPLPRTTPASTAPAPTTPMPSSATTGPLTTTPSSQPSEVPHIPHIPGLPRVQQ